MISAVGKHPAVVVHAPTGAGKTTALPGALLDAGLAGSGQIWCLEPRRIAARSAARHVASLRGASPGGEVGWHVRFEPKFSKSTRLLYLTDGTAVRRMQQDLLLESVGVVIFDEFHERSLASDLALAMVRRVQTELRPDLRLVVMSATLDATRVSQFLGDAPIIRSEGRAFPVDIRYLDRPDERRLPDRVANGVTALLPQVDGDLLAFLPGVGEIERTAGLLASVVDIDVLRLHGNLPSAEQDRALRVGPRRRVVLATNVAETSLTLDGIAGVVDSGQARILRYDPGSGLDRLALEDISKASADQRSGRAGRLGPGVALRLWTARSHPGRPDHDTPELQRTDLAGAVLQLLAWGEPDPATFPWVEAPPADTLDAGMALLRTLGLLGDSGLTERGAAAARLPLHPRLGVMVLEAAARGHVRLGALAAAILAERDILPRHPRGTPPPRPSASDLLDRCEALKARDRRIHPNRISRINQVADRIVSRVGRSAPRPVQADTGEDALLRAAAAGWPDRLALRRSADPTRGRLLGGRGVVLGPGCAVRRGRLFVCIQLNDATGPEATVHLASEVERGWLTETTHTQVRWDAERRQVVARREQQIGDLVLESHACALPDGDAVTRCLVEALRGDLSSLPLTEPATAGLRARLHHTARFHPDLGLPDPDEAWIAEHLAALVHGHRGLESLTDEGVAQRLWEQLDYQQRQQVERLAPSRIAVPSGSQIRLRWAWEGPPVLAVRLQEVFGWTETPTVMGGRWPVLMHLLAPNGRPAQITEDLASFWKNTYAEVRKELRRRYPKHAWPDDPTNAPPERRPRRKR